MQKTLLKPAIVAGIGVGLSKMMVSGQVLSLRGGTEVPLGVALFGALYAASLAGELAHSYLYPAVDPLQKFSVPASALTSVGLVGAADIAALYLANPDSINELGLGSVFIQAGVAEGLGDYIYSNFVAPLFVPSL